LSLRSSADQALVNILRHWTVSAHDPSSVHKIELPPGRVSLGIENSTEDVDAVIKVLDGIARKSASVHDGIPELQQGISKADE